MLLSFIPYCLAHSTKTANRSVYLLVMRDSQTGNSWSRSSFGNFLYGLLQKQPQNFTSERNLDDVVIVQRDRSNGHQQLGHSERSFTLVHLAEEFLTA
jgi:hypothetical protein